MFRNIRSSSRSFTLTRGVLIGEHETLALREVIFTVLQRKLPPKLKDPGRFIIPYTIGEKRFEKALLDLGASMNLIYVIFSL